MRLDRARRVLGEVPGWRLLPDEWAEVEDALIALGRSLRGEDLRAPHGVDGAVAALQLAGPTRAVSAASLAEDPPPPRVRERVAHLLDLATNEADRLGPVSPDLDAR